MVDQVDNGELQFSGNELKKLFLFKEGTICETHDTFKCKRCKNGKQILKAQALLYGDASTYVSFQLTLSWLTDGDTARWNHYGNEDLMNNHDDLLRAEYGSSDVSFVFQYVSH